MLSAIYLQQACGCLTWLFASCPAWCPLLSQSEILTRKLKLLFGQWYLLKTLGINST